MAMKFWFTKKDVQSKSVTAEPTVACTPQETPRESEVQREFVPKSSPPPCPAVVLESTSSNIPQKPILKPVVKSVGENRVVVNPTEPAPIKTPSVTLEEQNPIVPDDEHTLKIRPKMDQRALYYQLMNGLYDAVMVLDDRGHVVDCNLRVEEVLGYSREEAWDLPITKIITGMTRQLFEHLKRNLSENHHILIDSRCFRKDGTSFSGEVGVCTISLMRSNNIIFTIRNVDRRKNAMDELRKSQTLIEVAQSPVFACNPEGLFNTVNLPMLETFGVASVTSAKTLRLADLLPNAADLFARALKGEKVCEPLTWKKADGTSIHFRIALMPIRNGPDITGVAGSILNQ